AAQLLNQAVVAAAGTDSTLGAETIGNPFENRQAVVVQPAHQTRVDHIGYTGSIQQAAQALEVCAGIIAQIIGQFRCIHQQRLGIRVLAVEYPQRIGFQSPLAVLVQLVEASPQIGHQIISVASAVFAGAQTVQLQAHRLGQAQALPQTPAEHD